MYIGQVVTLKELILEIVDWMVTCKRKQKEGIWNDVVGCFCKVRFTKYNKIHGVRNKWTLLNSGVYKAKQHFYTRPSTQDQYTFIFKCTDCTYTELEKEVTRQYKNFIVKAKRLNIENDFGD